MVKPQLPKLKMRVRFPSPAPQTGCPTGTPFVEQATQMRRGLRDLFLSPFRYLSARKRGFAYPARRSTSSLVRRRAWVSSRIARNSRAKDFFRWSRRPGLCASPTVPFLLSCRAQTRVRICAAERVKLACKRQGAKYSRKRNSRTPPFTIPNEGFFHWSRKFPCAAYLITLFGHKAATIF